MSTQFNAREFQYADQLSKYVNASNAKHAGAIAVVAVMMTPSGSLLLFSNDLIDDAAAAAIDEVHEDFTDRGRGRGLESITADERAAEAAAIAEQEAAAKRATDAAATAAAAAAREARIRVEVDAEVRARYAAEESKA